MARKIMNHYRISQEAFEYAKGKNQSNLPQSQQYPPCFDICKEALWLEKPCTHLELHFQVTNNYVVVQYLNESKVGECLVFFDEDLPEEVTAISPSKDITPYNWFFEVVSGGIKD